MDSRRVEALEIEVVRLREQVAHLEALLMDTLVLPIEWRLTAQEARVFGALVNRDRATREQIHFALYGDSVDGGAEIKIVDVFVCKLRRKLKPFGIAIQTIWGQGYTLPNEVRARFRLRPPSEPRRPLPNQAPDRLIGAAHRGVAA